MQGRVRQARRHGKAQTTPHDRSHSENGSEGKVGSWPQNPHCQNANVNAVGQHGALRRAAEVAMMRNTLHAVPRISDTKGTE